MEIGKRIYYDKLTGEVILSIGERTGDVIIRTVEQDIQVYKKLSERNIESFSYIELGYGQYAQDFRECNGYRVNIDTLELEFSYPDPTDPNEIEPQEPVYQKPLSEEVKEQNNTINTLLLDNINMQMQIDTLIISNL